MATATDNKTPAPDPTPEKILDVALDLFAKKGFNGVSVREITNQAGCNLSAVNYHFGSKKNLYLEVFRQRIIKHAGHLLNGIDHLQKQPDINLRQLISALVRGFLHFSQEAELRQKHQRLMLLEMSKPTEAFQVLLKDMLRPVYGKFTEALAPYLPEKASQEELLLKCMSIMFQCVVFSFNRPLVTGLTGREYDDKFREDLIEHITRFSLGGLGIMEEGEA